MSNRISISEPYFPPRGSEFMNEVMNLSESWKSTWPVGAVFPAPALLAGAGAAHLGPLVFRPSLSQPPQTLFSSRHLHTKSEDEELVCNKLTVLSCRAGDLTHVLFFPAGENSAEIGYLGLSESRVESNCGEIFRQGDGYAHPSHRITGMSAVPLDYIDWETDVAKSSVNSPTLGHLLAATLYSVSFFKVVLLSNGGIRSKRVILVPTGRQAFYARVVDASWNPNFPEESIVLLENGVLHWIKPELSVGVKIKLQEGENCGFLHCEFGWKPWQVLIVSSVAVTMVDLRSKNGSKRSTLARIENPCAYTTVNSFTDDRFIAFSIAREKDYHFCVATEHHLFLYDSRQPLIPVLRWFHGLDSPRYLSVYPLRHLRPSEKYNSSSNSGSAIVCGSFGSSKFSIFCYGPKECEQDKSKNVMLYAWELPSDLCILDWKFSSADDLLREELYKQNKDFVLGFAILPSDSLSDPGSFSLLWLSSSGRLELQKHSAQLKTSKHDKDSVNTGDIPLMLDNLTESSLGRHDFFNLKFLSSYLSKNLVRTMRTEIKKQETSELKGSEIPMELPPSLSLLDYVKDVGIPSNINEITSRVALFSLDRNLLYLAFSRFSDLFHERRNSSFDFPGIENSVSLFLRKPSNMSMRGKIRSNSSRDELIGPILPLPLLLSLQSIQHEEDRDEDIMDTQCRKIAESVFPEISIASSEIMQEENPFMIHEPGSCIHDNIQTSKESGKCEELPSSSAKDDKFSVFVHGNREKLEGSEVFDGLSNFKLHFDVPLMEMASSERKIMDSLKRQFSMWQASGFDHDLCRPSKKRERSL